MNVISAKKKQKTASTTFLSPPRDSASSSRFVTVTPFASPPVLGGSNNNKRVRVDENDDVVFVGSNTIDPSIDFPHARFECPTHTFMRIAGARSEPISIGMNIAHCKKCQCYVCDQPADECSEWELHCNAHGQDPEWKKLKQEKSIPQDITPVPVSRHANKTVKQLKDILRKNGQHVTGRKAVLLKRIDDGEHYGRLAECPECERGRLKVMDLASDVVMCPGYYDREYVIPCDYICSAEEAPRIGPWIDPDQDTSTTTEDTDEIQALFEKLKVPQMKDILGLNGQHISGRKSTLLARIVDGFMFGRLGLCPVCRVGRLKVNDASPDQVYCPGHYEANVGVTLPCCFQCTAKEAPRAGPWQV